MLLKDIAAGKVLLAGISREDMERAARLEARAASIQAALGAALAALGHEGAFEGEDPPSIEFLVPTGTWNVESAHFAWADSNRRDFCVGALGHLHGSLDRIEELLGLLDDTALSALAAEEAESLSIF